MKDSEEQEDDNGEGEERRGTVIEEGRSTSGRKEGRKGSWKEGGFTARSQVVAEHGRTISTWRPIPPR